MRAPTARGFHQRSTLLPCDLLRAETPHTACILPTSAFLMVRQSPSGLHLLALVAARFGTTSHNSPLGHVVAVFCASMELGW